MNDLNFSALYRRYAGDVYRFSLYLSGDFALADDITAETFARAWVVRDRIRVGSVKAYLLMITRNLYRDTRRRRAETSLPEHFDVADPGARPDTSAEARDELRRALAALSRLPVHEREVLLMATVEGLTHQSIAVALGLSVNAVKVRVHRARVHLSEIRAGMENHHVDHTTRHP